MIDSFSFFHPTQLPRTTQTAIHVYYGCMCGGMVLFGIVFCILIDAKLHCGLEGKMCKGIYFLKDFNIRSSPVDVNIQNRLYTCNL